VADIVTLRRSSHREAVAAADREWSGSAASPGATEHASVAVAWAGAKATHKADPRTEPSLQRLLRETDPRNGVEPGLPVLPPLAELLGRRLKRGAVVAVQGDAARMSLAMALLAGVSVEGGWCGVVGVPSFGYVAASEFGIRLEQLAVVPEPGPVWAEATAALLPGLDLVLVQPPGPVSGRLARRLAARARKARCTVLTLGPAWEGSDIRLAAVDQEWSGLRQGAGRLRRRRITVSLAAWPRIELDLWLPDQDGRIRLVDEGTLPPVVPLADRRARAS